jgi:hypothetical protein
MDRILVSEALLDEVKQNPYMEIDGEPEEFPFDENGNLF